jgi:hypothetical protein
MAKERVNAIALPPAEDIHPDSKLFLEGSGSKEFQEISLAAIKHGFQTREGEVDPGKMLSGL